MTSVSKEQLATENVDQDVDTGCGLTPACQPKWLQKCADAKVFLVVLTAFGVVQGFAINGVNNVNTPVYERRYLLSSQSSSLVAVFYDISAGAFVLFVGYFGATTHQPRLLAVAFLSMGFGTLTMAAAHFTSPPYNPGSSSESTLCDFNNNTIPDEGQTYLKNYIYFLIFGQILNGFAGACIFSIGLTFLDHNSSAKNSALYIGIYIGGSGFGPAIGFLAGGSFLDIYVDSPKSPPGGLTRDDPAWVGAWWIPFVLSSALSFILAFFMFLFPRELPGTQAIQATKVSQAHDNGTEVKINIVSGFGIGWRDLPHATLHLLKNPCYMCVSLENALNFFLVMGVSTFLPKIISNQFSLSLGWSSILTGLLAVPSSAVAQVCGGAVIKRYDIKLKGILKFALISSVLSLVLIPVYLARCSNLQIAGVFNSYPGSNTDTRPTLHSTCNSECGCSTSTYEPVCADGIQYFSPCHAGCSLQPVETGDGIKVYHNCSCPTGQLPFSFTLTNNTNSEPVTEGKCKQKCTLLYTVFVPFLFIQIFFTFLSGTPLSVAILRAIPDKLKTYGVALSWVFLRFLGSIPGPIVFGTILDASCKVWQTDPDAETRGSCWIYDNDGMAIRIVVLLVVLKTVSLVFNSLALVLYRAPVSPSESVEVSHAVKEHNEMVMTEPKS